MDNVISNLQEFVIKEIEYLRQATEASIKEIRSVERYALLATGAIWSWCASNFSGSGTKSIIWLPFFITLLLGLRCFAIKKEIDAIDKHAAHLEQALGLPNGLGWEMTQVKKRAPFEVVTAGFFWGLLQLGTLIIPLLFTCGIITLPTK